MTTIATDGITIAADGRRTRGWEITTDRCKKISVEHVDGHWAIFAIAGKSAMRSALVSWYFDGADPAKAPKGTGDEGEWMCLVIRAKGCQAEMIRYASECPYPQDVIELPYAVGSGQEFARAAMLMGGSPRRAIEIAIQCDAASGGEIQVVDIAEALGLQPTLKLIA